MKVLVFIDHDIICRNFIISGALSALINCSKVHFVFPQAGGKRMHLSPAELPLEGSTYSHLATNSQRQLMWRWILFRDQLRLCKGRHEAAIRRLRWRTLGWKAAFLLTLAGAPLFSIFFNHFISNKLIRFPDKDLEDLLDKESPDIIFHPSVLEGPFINDLIPACQNRRIPLVVAMNSWDNPSTKRAVVGCPDYLLVWGEQTREHAIRFMGMHKNYVLTFGAAQFDVLSNPPRQDREQMLLGYGISPSSLVVLYAGSNALVDELGILKIIDEIITQQSLVGISVIYRPHPWGGGGFEGGRFGSHTFKNVKIDPSMQDYIRSLNGGKAGITLPDPQNSRDLLCAVDVVISPMSTILLEAALLGKPIIIHSPKNGLGQDPLANGLPMLHFDELLSLPGVEIARSSDELINALMGFLDAKNRINIGAVLKHSVQERLVSYFDESWGDRLCNLLVALCKKSNKSKINPTKEVDLIEAGSVTRGCD